MKSDNSVDDSGGALALATRKSSLNLGILTGTEIAARMQPGGTSE